MEGRNYVTPVKFQNPFGTCWGFAAVAAAESSILGSLLKDDPEAYKNLDLSEKQLAYFAHTYLNQPSSSQNGEGTHHVKISSSADVYGGGTHTLATATFAQGIGPVHESRGADFEYHGKNKEIEYRDFDGSGKYYKFSYDAEDDWNLDEDLRFQQDFVMQESSILPDPAIVAGTSYTYNPAGTAAIKKELVNRRAVLATFHADTSSPNQELGEDGEFLSTKNWAHYTYDPLQGPNHAVTIVGWDDNYPAENFVKGHQPPVDLFPDGQREGATNGGNGAWLVKNSWGSGEQVFPNKGYGNWGLKQGQDKGPEYKATSDINTGYFWLSYYDASLKNCETFIFDENKGTDEYYLDAHDYMPAMAILSNPKEDVVKMANVFKAEGNEVLKAVSCLTDSPKTTVSYDIYILNDESQNPEDGDLIEQVTGSEVIEYAGFHKLSLETPVNIQKGQSYAIVVTQKHEDGKYAATVPMSFGPEMSSMTGGTYQVGVVNKGESYLYSDGKWQDAAEKGVLLSATTIPASDFAQYDIVFDNFPIKGFCDVNKSDVKMRLSGDNLLLPDENKKSTTIKLRFTSTGDVDIAGRDIKWSLGEGGEEFVTLTPNEKGTQAELTAVEGKIGMTRLYVDVPGIGSQSIPIYVGHDWQEPVYTISIETNQAIAQRTCRHNATHGQFEISTGTSKVTKQPTTTSKGETTYTFQFLNPAFETQTKVVANIPMLPKKANTMTAKAKKVTAKAKTLEKKAVKVKKTKAFAIKNAKGTVTFKKLSGNKKIIVNSKTGKLTLKKGLKKKTYKVKVQIKAAGDKNYKPATKTVTLKVRVK